MLATAWDLNITCQMSSNIAPMCRVVCLWRPGTLNSTADLAISDMQEMLDDAEPSIAGLQRKLKKESELKKEAKNLSSSLHKSLRQ
jgi:hypothetical protein